MNLPVAFAVESGHWYAADGSPCYRIPAKEGGDRPTTLRDARKLGLLPSVTEVLKCAPKPALETWKVNQGILAALTLPRLEGEADDAFCARVLNDSKEQSRKAAERGERLHAALESYARGGSYKAEWQPHVEAVEKALAGRGIRLRGQMPEKSFASPHGYGGKIDLQGLDDLAVSFKLDFKSKERIAPDLKAYPEQGMQLVAYAEGDLALRLLNVFVGCEDAKVFIHEWADRQERTRYWRMFMALHSYWCESRGYYPAQAKAEAA